jgi:hypothetical protein
MTDKKQAFEDEMMTLPLQRLVLGDVPAPDPDKRFSAGQKQLKLDPEMESTVKRLIAHLKNGK